MEEYPKSEKPNKSKERRLRGREFLRMKEEIIRDEKYIKIDDCKDGYLYIIIARNADIGIYGEKGKVFTINRKKFDERFLFDEDHWDTGAPFGTAIPLKEIEKAPEFANDNEKLAYLAKKAEELGTEIEKTIWDEN